MTENRLIKKGGGVAILFNDSFKCTKLSYGNFASFEHVALQLRSSPQAIFLNIYRPPKYCAAFFEDFAELLSAICIDFDCVIIAGDFNIHVDNPQDRGTKELCCIFENYGLTQHVTQATQQGTHLRLDYLQGSEHFQC